MYEYRCPGCQTTFERWVGLSEAAPPCPECGAAEVARLISRFSSMGAAQVAAPRFT